MPRYKSSSHFRLVLGICDPARVPSNCYSVQATVKPRDRTWLPTKLGAVWRAVVNGSTVQQLRVRYLSSAAISTSQYPSLPAISRAELRDSTQLQWLHFGEVSMADGIQQADTAL